MSRKFQLKEPTAASVKVEIQQDNIVFGFSEIRPFSYIDCRNDSEFFISFIERLKKLSSLTWKVIGTSARHSFGFEKLETKYLTPSAKTHVPKGMESLLVFRATGDNHAFLGYRDGNTFQIVFIEHDFGDVYKH